MISTQFCNRIVKIVRILGIVLLLFLFAWQDCAQASLPVLALEAAQLNYAFSRPGTLLLGEEAYPITVKYRGTYSATFTGKRSYSLHLKDRFGSQAKASLLGLRYDDDYVLLGALSDPCRLRNAVGMDLWRALGHPAPASAPCEVTFASHYKGLYFLFERPDRKSAAVPHDGALYRVLAARVNDTDVLCDPATAPSGDTWFNLEKVYPAEDEGWNALLSMLSSPESFLDLNAFADYFLYVNLIGASDNMSKNLYLCFDGTRFYPMPWDLDAAFGRLYNAEPSDPSVLYSAPFFDQLLRLPAFTESLHRRYSTLQPLLAPEIIAEQFSARFHMLSDNGVWEREAARFGTYTDATTGQTHALDPVGELAALPAFLSARAELVAAFIRTLP